MNIETHIVPASISAALHAALFLAFSAGAAGPRITTEKPRQEDRPNLRWEEFTPPPEDIPPGDEPERRTAKGNPVPEIPDPPARPTWTDLTVDVRPPSIRPDLAGPLARPGFPGGFDPENRPGTPAILSVQDLDGPPRATAQMPPAYPGAMRQAGIGGEVVVEFAVDASGRVTSAQILRCAHREFVEPTLRAVLAWRFEPGRRQGRAVPFRMVVPVDFSVGGP